MLIPSLCEPMSVAIISPASAKPHPDFLRLPISGGRAFVPPIPGLEDVPYLTNANLFNLEALPSRLGILGAGAVGLEMAQVLIEVSTSV